MAHLRNIARIIFIDSLSYHASRQNYANSQKYSTYPKKGRNRKTEVSMLDQFLLDNSLSLLPLLLGAVLGMATASVLFLYPGSPVFGVFNWAKFQIDAEIASFAQPSGKVTKRPRTLDEEVHIRQTLYVGVMTAEKFLTTRATAVNKTWGKYVDKMEFYAQKGSYEQYKLNLVNLDVDDSIYPPQQKAFTMLQYICDHHINDFDWFIRSDDDVYMKVDKLRELLGTFDRDQIVVLGQPGYGREEERDTLGLEGDNFCMGGPGVIFSRPALLGLCPHIAQCKKEVYSNQEDVEIGRCVTKHLGIQCTSSYDIKTLFYHAYKEDYGTVTPFTNDLDSDLHFQSAITLHHAKQPNIMYNIHFYHLQDQYRTLQQFQKYYQGRLAHVEMKLNRTYNQTNQEVVESEKRYNLWQQMTQEVDVPWNHFTKDAVYGDVMAISELKCKLQEIVQQGLFHLKSTNDKALKAERFESGYWRYVPEAGTQYMLDFSVVMTDSPRTNHLPETSNTVRVHLIEDLLETHINYLHSYSKFYSVKVVVPLYINNLKLLVYFMQKLENNNIFMTGLPIQFSFLIIVYCKNILENEDTPKIRDLIQEYQTKYTHINFNILFRTTYKMYNAAELFSVVMNEKYISKEEFILYIKPKVYFDVDFVNHCKRNSVKGQMIFHAFSEMSNSSYKNEGDDVPHVVCGFGSDLKLVHLDQKDSKEGTVPFIGIFHANIRIFKTDDQGLFQLHNIY